MKKKYHSVDERELNLLGLKICLQRHNYKQGNCRKVLVHNCVAFHNAIKIICNRTIKVYKSPKS
jgi:hypothetical protein